MLIRFEAANFRSILDPVELSMVAIDEDRDGVWPVPNMGQSLLSVAAIFGPNASGKTNVLAALTWISRAVFDSLRFWDDGIPVEHFALNGSESMASTFTVESVIHGIRFEYVVELDSDSIHYEGLFHYPEKKRRRIFERDESGLKFQRGLGGLSGTRELLTERALVLSIARRFPEPLVTEFAYDLMSVQSLGLPRSRRPVLNPFMSSTIQWFDDDRDNLQPTLFDDDERDQVQADRNQALAMLQLADFGISDVLVEQEEIASLGANSRVRRTVRLMHRTGEGSAPLDFSQESEGTRTWYRLIGPVLSALRHGSVLLFDELDASLHPTLSAELIRLFQRSDTNPNGAQLIFTSHDTSLLNDLNRDEVWLTEKTEKGATRLGALADFAGERVRRSANLESAYLHGRFGALPDVDRTDLLRALRLIG
ncbi:AAA family ATPase [Phytomonospora endophytica]|uniref:ATPase AAA-type core domain-containing protein n=1 Tax=Phytomonospora endophytica TaxID=714109 RepID=A0A841G245_9ACTN|nr:ATP-binding protein [Phytomonospora endophytica]MBB6038220.1 hypothetical protein [Phytomonospora endophytica]